MLTTEGVAQVAYTAEPAHLGNWSLTIDDIIRATTAADWDDWVRLKPAAAARLAATLNALRPWKRSARRALASMPAVIEGEIVDSAVVA